MVGSKCIDAVAYLDCLQLNQSEWIPAVRTWRSHMCPLLTVLCLDFRQILGRSFLVELKAVAIYSNYRYRIFYKPVLPRW